MKIFLTGATGFIGKHLCKQLLDRGHTVFALSRSKDSFSEAGPEQLIPVVGDIREKASYESVFENGIDIVYHLAAIPGQKWGVKRKDYQETNIRATADLLEACRARVKRFIFCSSINALNADRNFLRDAYGKSKFEAEKIVESYAGKGLNTLVIRPAVVYGPGDISGMMLKLCRLIEKRKFRLVGSGKNVIPFVHVDDLVQAFLNALENGQSGQIFEITGPDNPPFREVVGIISEILKREIPGWRVPVWLAHAAAITSENLAKLAKKEPLISRHRVDILTGHRNFPIQKAKDAPGYEPQKKLADGLRETIHWYKENGYL